MTMQRQLVLAVVTGVKDGNTVTYPCCCQCHCKLLLDPVSQRWHCLRCGVHLEGRRLSWRYRLVLTVADNSAVGDVVVFGSTLDDFFGKSASDFNRSLTELERTGYPSQALLYEALTKTFCGRYFYLGFRSNGAQTTSTSSTTASCLSDVFQWDASQAQGSSQPLSAVDTEVCHTVVYQMIPNMVMPVQTVTDHIRRAVFILRYGNSVEQANDGKQSPPQVSKPTPTDRNSLQSTRRFDRTSSMLGKTISFCNSLQDSVLFSFEDSPHSGASSYKHQLEPDSRMSFHNGTDSDTATVQCNTVNVSQDFVELPVAAAGTRTSPVKRKPPTFDVDNCNSFHQHPPSFLDPRESVDGMFSPSPLQLQCSPRNSQNCSFPVKTVTSSAGHCSDLTNPVHLVQTAKVTPGRGLPLDTSSRSGTRDGPNVCRTMQSANIKCMPACSAPVVTPPGIESDNSLFSSQFSDRLMAEELSYTDCIRKRLFSSNTVLMDSQCKDHLGVDGDSVSYHCHGITIPDLEQVESCIGVSHAPSSQVLAVVDMPESENLDAFLDSFCEQLNLSDLENHQSLQAGGCEERQTVSSQNVPTNSTEIVTAELQNKESRNHLVSPGVSCTEEKQIPLSCDKDCIDKALEQSVCTEVLEESTSAIKSTASQCELESRFNDSNRGTDKLETSSDEDLEDFLANITEHSVIVNQEEICSGTTDRLEEALHHTKVDEDMFNSVNEEISTYKLNLSSQVSSVTNCRARLDSHTDKADPHDVQRPSNINEGAESPRQQISRTDEISCNDLVSLCEEVEGLWESLSDEDFLLAEGEYLAECIETALDGLGVSPNNSQSCSRPSELTEVQDRDCVVVIVPDRGYSTMASDGQTAKPSSDHLCFTEPRVPVRDKLFQTSAVQTPCGEGSQDLFDLSHESCLLEESAAEVSNPITEKEVLDSSGIVFESQQSRNLSGNAQESNEISTVEQGQGDCDSKKVQFALRLRQVKSVQLIDLKMKLNRSPVHMQGTGKQKSCLKTKDDKYAFNYNLPCENPNPNVTNDSSVLEFGSQDLFDPSPVTSSEGVTKNFRGSENELSPDLFCSSTPESVDIFPNRSSVLKEQTSNGGKISCVRKVSDEPNLQNLLIQNHCKRMQENFRKRDVLLDVSNIILDSPDIFGYISSPTEEVVSEKLCRSVSVPVSTANQSRPVRRDNAVSPVIGLSNVRCIEDGMTVAVYESPDLFSPCVQTKPVCDSKTSTSDDKSKTPKSNILCKKLFF